MAAYHAGADSFILKREQVSDATDFDNLYVFESLLMTRIREGRRPVNTEGIPVLLNDYFMNLVPNYMKYIKAQYATLTGLATSRAIEGGVNPNIAFMLWEYYLGLGEHASDLQELETLVNVMLEDFAGRSAAARLPDNLPSRLRDAVRYLRHRLGSQVKIEDVARAVGCSRSQLDRDFHKYLGCSPKQFLTRERIAQANHFLTRTNVSVTELGQALGFSSTSHFCNTYKKVTGQTVRSTRQNGLSLPK